MSVGESKSCGLYWIGWNLTDESSQCTFHSICGAPPPPPGPSQSLSVSVSLSLVLSLVFDFVISSQRSHFKRHHWCSSLRRAARMYLLCSRLRGGIPVHAPISVWYFSQCRFLSWYAGSPRPPPPPPPPPSGRHQMTTVTQFQLPHHPHHPAAPTKKNKSKQLDTPGHNVTDSTAALTLYKQTNRK